jgi:hypothetical protein
MKINTIVHNNAIYELENDYQNSVDMFLFSPHLIELRLRTKNKGARYIREVSYSGDFLVIWSVSKVG